MNPIFRINTLKKIAMTVAAGLFFGSCFTVFAVSDSLPVNLTVDCNRNGVCEANLGEDHSNCPDDCPDCNNDSACDVGAGETRLNCSNDCSVCDLNGVCDVASGETEDNCPADCQYIPPFSPAVSVGSAGLPSQALRLPTIYNLSVGGVTLVSAQINWDTDIASRCQLKYGKGGDYVTGIISETDFSKKHLAALSGLYSGEVYDFQVICANINDKTSQTGNQKFSTLDLPDMVPPANAGNFTAKAGDNSVSLEWANPADDDFAGVRIVRSGRFYPEDPWSGQIVYEGNGSSFNDRDLDNGKTYYYAAFVYDNSGNYSSGAVASAIPGQPGRTADIPVAAAPAEIEKLGLRQFQFEQDGKAIEPDDNRIAIDRYKTFTISIPYNEVPKVLKTIMMTLNKEGKPFSFLLRANKEKTFYTATLVPPDTGNYPFDITILDYKNRAFKKISGHIDVVKSEIMQSREGGATAKYIVIRKIPPIIYIVLAIIAVIILRKVYKKIQSSKFNVQSEN